MSASDPLRAAPAEASQRPPLLFVHGAWHGAWCWADHWLPWFAARGWDCTAVTLRGHGAEETALRWASAADYIDDILAAAATLPRQPVLIGHSLGGYLVARILEQHTFPAAALLAPVPAAGSLPALLRGLLYEPGAILGAALTLNPGRIVHTPRRARRFLFTGDTPEVTVRHALDRLSGESMRVIIETALRLPRASAIRTRGVPLLVLAAEADGLFTPAEQERTAQAYGAAHARLPGAGHDLMLAPRWETAARLLAGWLEVNVSPSRVKVG
jgi:pimeloyl-ACP methyl ester carboxylesterase